MKETVGLAYVTAQNEKTVRPLLKMPGFMMAPWGGLTDDGIYYNKDGAIRLLRARERVYPETLN